MSPKKLIQTGVFCLPSQTSLLNYINCIFPPPQPGCFPGLFNWITATSLLYLQQSTTSKTCKTWYFIKKKTWQVHFTVELQMQHFTTKCKYFGKFLLNGDMRQLLYLALSCSLFLYLTLSCSLFLSLPFPSSPLHFLAQSCSILLSLVLYCSLLLSYLSQICSDYHMP